MLSKSVNAQFSVKP